MQSVIIFYCYAHVARFFPCTELDLVSLRCVHSFGCQRNSMCVFLFHVLQFQGIVESAVADSLEWPHRIVVPIAQPPVDLRYIIIMQKIVACANCLILSEAN